MDYCTMEGFATGNDVPEIAATMAPDVLEQTESDALKRLLALLDAHKEKVLQRECGKYTVHRKENMSFIYLANNAECQAW